MSFICFTTCKSKFKSPVNSYNIILSTYDDTDAIIYTYTYINTYVYTYNKLVHE